MIYLSGIFSAFHAAVRTRTAQGAVAWTISLITFPYLALPLYWIFGRGRFHGYVAARRSGDLKIHNIATELRGRLLDAGGIDGAVTPSQQVLETLAGMPFTRGNNVDLLEDGGAAYGAMFGAIDEADDYILLQSYLIRDDDLGRDLKARLLRKARNGLAVYLLYDEIGSYGLPPAFGAELKAGGVRVCAFSTTQGPINRFQLNFRNHRKTLVVDGRLAFVGGLNFGDEYLGRDGQYGPWRDTHVYVSGPAVQAVQLAFVEDWYWAAHEVPELLWEPRKAEQGGKLALVLPTGPADYWDSCELFLLEVITTAKRRIWIASPYFVPDEQIIGALQLARLRGVEVRILLSKKADHFLVDWASYAHYPMAERAGIEIYRYDAGFLHQKVLLVDDTLASVGTANLDNRSFRLNFEISMVIWDRGFAGEVEAMLLNDFSASRKVVAGELDEKPLWFRFGVSLSRLLAPIL
ncbi:cardiolipin synthase [Pelagibius litoralis]|uniref:cardiolipin synthase n=1 Tax=Pelagibius litoralis TaxID=374515 RepID=UPI001F0EE3B0|nr:cardiolipin synthase [Pelagibius litoralis]